MTRRGYAPKEASLAERLALGVDQRGPDECWLWTKGTDREGYGMIGIREGGRLRMRKAHVVAYTLDAGSAPQHLVLHRCDTPPCCNPAHLYDGTHRDNARDRSHAGTARWQAVLTWEAVEKIRSEFQTHRPSMRDIRDLAAQHDVSTRTIADVIAQNTWKVDQEGNLIDKRRAENCLYGHPKTAPNLTAARPACLACQRAHGREKVARRQGVPFDFKAVADAVYLEIMTNSYVDRRRRKTSS